MAGGIGREGGLVNVMGDCDCLGQRCSNYQASNDVW